MKKIRILLGEDTYLPQLGFRILLGEDKVGFPQISHFGECGDRLKTLDFIQFNRCIE